MGAAPESDGRGRGNLDIDSRAQLTRRSFLARVSASAFVAATHAPMVWGDENKRTGLPAPKKDSKARIQHLHLQTTTPLADLKKFYCDVLGMPLLANKRDSKKDKEITFVAGASKITFLLSNRGKAGDPFYHFAFNIPENKHQGSKAWLSRQKIKIHSVNHFKSWNAHAVFFLDPAGNLLEFIARHDLKNAASGTFTPKKDILCTSEIAFLVTDVPNFASGMKKALGIGDYRPGSKQYATPGDEHGLLLVFKQGRKWHKPAQTFPAVVRIAGKKGVEFEPSGYPYRIST